MIGTISDGLAVAWGFLEIDVVFTVPLKNLREQGRKRELPDGSDWPPEEVVKFDVPAHDIGVKLGRSQSSKELSSVQQGCVVGQEALGNGVEVAIHSGSSCTAHSTCLTCPSPAQKVPLCKCPSVDLHFRLVNKAISQPLLMNCTL